MSSSTLMFKTPRMRISAAAVVAFAAALVACGDAGVTTTTITTTSVASTTSVPPTTISDPFGFPIFVEVEARDFEFFPASWTVPPDAFLNIDFENRGTVEHFFVIIKDGIFLDNSAQFDESLVFHEVGEDPRQSTQSGLRSPRQPGTYQVICKVPGHLEAGMVAELIVEP